MNKPILFFDVIGTVVDWLSAIRGVGSLIAPEVDWHSGTKAWLHEEFSLQRRVESGEVGWLNRDQLQRQSLDAAIPAMALKDLTPAERESLASAWDEALPWPDVREGIKSLRESYCVVALSNSTIQALERLSDRGRLQWDAILSAELFRAYKPNPRVYIEACKVMRTEPRDATMVAAHLFDLQAAKGCGMSTAFVERPTGDLAANAEKTDYIDTISKNFIDLSHQLQSDRSR